MRKDLEGKLQVAEQEAEELKESVEKEAQNYADELRKHKAALMQLLTNQCRLESDMGRALGQVEAAKEEFKEVVLRKEEADAMVVKLSEDVAKMRSDCELKDKVLSAVMRKCKLDTAEKQVLLKEVDRLRVEKKQAEVEIGRWRELWQSKHKKSSRVLRAVEAGCSKDEQLELLNRCKPNHLLFGYQKDQGRKHRHLSDEPGKVDSTTRIIYSNFTLF